MEPVIERPALPFDLRGLVQALIAICQQYGQRINRLLRGPVYPLTDAEAAAGITQFDIADDSYPEGHVRRYGAVGDGTADDSAAFVLAERTGRVLMDKGTFSLGTSGWTVSKAVLEVIGAGLGLSTITYKGTGKAIYAPNLIERTHWEGFDLLLNGASGGLVQGIVLDNAERSNTLRDIRVRSSPGDGIVLGGWGVRLFNVLVEFCSGSGVLLDDSSGTELHGCMLRSNGICLEIRKGRGISVYGGVIEKGTTNSILIAGADRVSLYAPRCEGAENQIVITSAPDGTRASNITMYGSHTLGATAASTGSQILVDEADDVVIHDPVFFSTVSTAYGVRVSADAGSTTIYNPRSLNDIQAYDISAASNARVILFDEGQVTVIEGGGDADGPELYLRNTYSNASAGNNVGIRLGRTGRQIRLASVAQGTFGRAPDLVIETEGDGEGISEKVRIKNGGAIELTAIVDPGNAPANKGRIYMRNNGGKTEFVAVFPSGAAQVIATEP